MRFFKQSKKQKDRDSRDETLVLGDDTPFSIREAYKTLRTNIMFSMPAGDRGKMVGLTSVSKGEGKSTTSLNLAIAISEMGRKVIMLDCDLRLSRVDRRLGINSDPGVSDYLVGQASLDESIQRVPGYNLDVMTSGNIPPNPTELMESANMEQLCNILTERYEYVIADLPPVGVVSDPLIMSKYMDGMVLVVRQNWSSRDGVKSAVEQLNFVDTRILGVIFTGQSDGKSGGYGRYGYGRKRGYGYGYEYGYGYGHDHGHGHESGGRRKRGSGAEAGPEAGPGADAAVAAGTAAGGGVGSEAGSGGVGPEVAAAAGISAGAGIGSGGGSRPVADG